MRRAMLLLAGLTACAGDPLPPEAAADPDPVSTFRIVPLDVDQLLVGRTANIQVEVTRRSGAAATTSGPVRFRSTSPGVLAVDQAGLVTAVSEGPAFIAASAEAGGRSFSDSVRLVAVNLGYTVSVAPSQLRALMVGQTGRAWLVARNAAGDSIALPGAATFRSTDPAVLTVDSAGTITTRAMGNTVLIGTVQTPFGPVADSLAVTAYCTAELRSDYDPPPDPLTTGTTFPLRVRLSTCSGHVILTDAVTWFTSDSSIVSIDPAGPTATARKPGDAVIWVRGRQYGAFGVLPVTVVP